MSLRQISYRLELSFWQIIICLLSDSSAVQRLIKWAYTDLFAHSAGVKHQIDKKKLFLWAFVGFGLGSIIGLLISLF